MHRLASVSSALALLLSFTACSSGDTQPDPAPPTTVAIKGTIEDCFFSATCAGPAALVSTAAVATAKDGRVIVFAVDADANVHQASTLATGQFSIQVPVGKSYVVLFRDSSGVFLGTLIVNAAPASLTASADLDLGTVSIDTATKEATSSNETALAGSAASSTVSDPGDVTFGTATKQVSLSLYSANVPGTLRITTGCGDCAMGDTQPRIELFASQWDATLQREVIVEWNWRCDGSDGTNCPTPVLNDKLYRYLTPTQTCEVGWESKAGYEPNAFCFPDLLEFGTPIAFGNPPDTVTFEVLRTEAAATILTLDGVARAALVVAVDGSGGRGYMWSMPGLGEVLLTDLTTLPTSAADLGRVQRRLVCQVAPDRTTVLGGTCPSWATTDFLNALPTTFPTP